ncbi:hypothetical protein SUDANB145_06884 [Streptomyces sp. enrichment culture]
MPEYPYSARPRPRTLSPARARLARWGPIPWRNRHAWAVTFKCAWRPPRISRGSMSCAPGVRTGTGPAPAGPVRTAVRRTRRRQRPPGRGTRPGPHRLRQRDAALGGPVRAGQVPHARGTAGAVRGRRVRGAPAHRGAGTAVDRRAGAADVRGAALDRGPGRPPGGGDGPHRAAHHVPGHRAAPRRPYRAQRRPVLRGADRERERSGPGGDRPLPRRDRPAAGPDGLAAGHALRLPAGRLRTRRCLLHGDRHGLRRSGPAAPDRRRRRPGRLVRAGSRRPGRARRGPGPGRPYLTARWCRGPARGGLRGPRAAGGHARGRRRFVRPHLPGVRPVADPRQPGPADGPLLRRVRPCHGAGDRLPRRPVPAAPRGRLADRP